MKLLVIDCCIRGEWSGTKRLYESYLDTLGEEVEIERLYLCEEDLQPMLMDAITKRTQLLAEGALDHEMFRYAHQFVGADRILIAAPYWDWSFPSLLKVYLEHVSVSGLTFRYEGADCIGQCRADRILYFATCGGYLTGAHQGVEYMKEIGAMFGIPEVEAYVIEGLDVEPERREERLAQGIADMHRKAAYAKGRLYKTDSYRKEGSAAVVSCEKDEQGYRIVLDQTVFFPEGGGQPGDTGVLELEGVQIAVTDTQEKDGCIYHKTQQPVEPGSTVNGRIDFAQRFDRMQQHTGEHIVSGIAHRLYGCENVGFHLGEACTTLDFDQDLTWEQVEEIERQANEAVFANLPIRILYPGKEALAQMEYRSKIEIEGQVRIVEIPGIDRCACCAPHVHRTGEIGLIKILSCDRHRGGCRLVMLCGMRALHGFREKQNSVSEVSVLLSAKPDRIAEAVAHAKEQQNALREQLNGMQEVYLKQRLEKIHQEDALVCIFEKELDQIAVRNFVNAAMERCDGICAAFVGTDESGYRYILGSRTADTRMAAKELNQCFAGKGGGKPEMVQGSLTGAQEEIRAVLERLTAES